MKFCIVGAGAIGGLLAVRLALAGETVSVIDRGAQLAAIRARGLLLLEPDGSRKHAPDVFASADFAAPGPQDYVILALKAHQIADVAPRLGPLLGESGALVTVQNGLPWWYFEKHGGEHDGRRLRALDADGSIAGSIPAGRIIGCVAYPAATLPEPGVARLVEGNRFTLGEPDGSPSARCTALAEALGRAGFKSFVIPDIRAELWLKAWGALSFNTISALTGTTMEQIANHALARGLVTDMMREAQQIAAKLGIAIRHDIERRIEGARNVGAHKTSMLQDLEAGREMETGALIGSMMELAELTGTPAPAIGAVHACCELLNSRLRAAVATG